MKNSKIIVVLTLLSMFITLVGCNKQAKFSDENWEVYDPETLNAYISGDDKYPSSYSIIIENDGYPLIEWNYPGESEYYELRQFKWTNDGWIDLRVGKEGIPVGRKKIMPSEGGFATLTDKKDTIHFCQDNEESILYFKGSKNGITSIEGTGLDHESEESMKQAIIFDDSILSLCGPVFDLDIKLFPHIVWIEDYRRKIVYIRWDGKNWVCADGSIYDMKDSDPSNPKYLDGHSRTSSFTPSIAVDKDNNPHIVLVKGTGASSEIWYTKWDGKNWDARSDDDITEMFESISLTHDKSNAPSIAVDSSGFPHVCWYDQSFDEERLSEVIYIKWDGANWVCVDGSIYDSKNADKSNPVNVSKNSGFSGYPVLALDRDDNPHIVWENGDKYRTEGIAYVRWNGTNWVCPKKSRK